MKKAILLASYGAGTDMGRDGIRQFECLCRARFPDVPMRWAYTSLRVRERIARERQKSDSVSKALLRLYFERHEAVAIQPLQAISGKEYAEVKESAERLGAETGMRISLGRPLLDAEKDLAKVANALKASLPEEREEGENVVFVGHGARHPAVSLYSKLSDELQRLDDALFVGTLRGDLELENVLPKLNSKRVWLLPLLSLVGGHAIRDMAGEEDESWKSRICASGHECIPVLKGLAQSAEVSTIWLNNLEFALNRLDTVFPASAPDAQATAMPLRTT